MSENNPDVMRMMSEEEKLLAKQPRLMHITDTLGYTYADIWIIAQANRLLKFLGVDWSEEQIDDFASMCYQSFKIRTPAEFSLMIDWVKSGRYKTYGSSPKAVFDALRDAFMQISIARNNLSKKQAIQEINIVEERASDIQSSIAKLAENKTVKK